MYKIIFMKTITIPLDISEDIMIALNETEEELKVHFQAGIAMMLYKEGKLTLGKAKQLSGLSRYEFEKLLSKHKIPISNLNYQTVISDLELLKGI